MIDTKEAIRDKKVAIEEIVALNSQEVKPKAVNKRIEFSSKSIRRIEAMIPLYSQDLGESPSNSEIFSYIVERAIDSMFEHDFKKRIEEI